MTGRHHPRDRLRIRPVIAQKGDEGSLRGRGKKHFFGSDIPDRARGAQVGEQFDSLGVMANDREGTVGDRRTERRPVGVFE